MKCAVIVYHQNALKIYKQEWIDRCLKSIEEQTFKNFEVFELNYGDDNTCFSDKFNFRSQFINKKMENHIEAMNWLIDITVLSGFDVIFNINLDDYYNIFRFEYQLRAIRNGAQLVSSNFNYFNDERGIFKRMDMIKYVNVGIQLRKNHNVIAHPVVAFHRSFFNDGLRYNTTLLGKEDLELWQRADRLGRKMVILPNYLLNYRIHENQITQTYKA